MLRAPEYRFLSLHPSYAPNGDRVVAELPLESVNFSRMLSGAGGLTGKINRNHPAATLANMRAGYHQIVVERDGRVAWCGPLWTVQTTLGGKFNNDPYLQLGCMEWFSWLLPQGDTTNCLDDDPFTGGGEWDNLDQIEIATDVVILSQLDRPGQAGNADQGINVDVGDNPPSGVLRTMGPYLPSDYKDFGGIITDMAQKEDGFDFTIESEWDDTSPYLKLRKRFCTWFPRKKGRAKLGLTSEMKLSQASGTWDATRMGTHAIANGADALVSHADASNDYWRRDLRRSYADTSDQTALDQQTIAAVKRYGQPVNLPQISVLNDRSTGQDLYYDFELGQITPTKFQQGYLDINDLMRIVAYDVTVVDGGGETINFLLNFPEDADLA